MGFTKVSLLIQNQCMTICLLVPALLRRGCWPSEHCRGPFSVPALLRRGCWTRGHSGGAPSSGATSLLSPSGGRDERASRGGLQQAALRACLLHWGGWTSGGLPPGFPFCTPGFTNADIRFSGTTVMVRPVGRAGPGTCTCRSRGRSNPARELSLPMV